MSLEKSKSLDPNFTPLSLERPKFHLEVPGLHLYLWRQVGFEIQTLRDLKIIMEWHKQSMIHSITARLWGCTLSFHVIFPTAFKQLLNSLTKEMFSLLSGLPSDLVLLPSGFVLNSEQLCSPSMHLGYWNLREDTVSHTVQLANPKMTSSLDARALYHFSWRWALYLTLHLQVKRQKHEMKSAWQTAQALQQQLHVQVGFMGLWQWKCHSRIWHHCLLTAGGRTFDGLVGMIVAINPPDRNGFYPGLICHF